MSSTKSLAGKKDLNDMIPRRMHDLKVRISELGLFKGKVRDWYN